MSDFPTIDPYKNDKYKVTTKLKKPVVKDGEDISVSYFKNTRQILKHIINIFILHTNTCCQDGYLISIENRKKEIDDKSRFNTINTSRKYFTLFSKIDGVFYEYAELNEFNLQEIFLEAFKYGGDIISKKSSAKNKKMYVTIKPSSEYPDRKVKMYLIVKLRFLEKIR